MSTHSATRRGPHTVPKGFTLFEILLVLALLAIMGALSWSPIHGAYQTYRIRSAAEQVRTGLGKARNAAMTTGKTHMFRYELDGTSFVVEPWTGAAADAQGETEASTQSGTDKSLGVDQQGNGKVEHLVDGLKFHSGDMANDIRAEMTLANDSGRDAIGQNWASPVLYFPDGTSVDAIIRLYNERGRVLPVTVRGLNGTSRIGDVQAVEGLR